MQTPAIEEQMRAHLVALYGEQPGAATYARLAATLAAFAQQHAELRAATGERLTENDVIVITYGDQVREAGRAPLETLGEVLTTTLGDVVSGVHLLPFYPYTSDDGFSVVDYAVVDPQLGDWADLQPLRAHYRMMYDAVINHISAESAWFQAFLRGEPGAASRFIAVDPATDLSLVTRPRTTPLLTPFATPSGTQHIWTTFSADQIDLDYASPDLLLEMIDVLLLYVAQGAELIRLDAIGYLWKEIGTRCIHLPQTHRVVQLWRAVLDAVAPNVLLITETNVPHADNISYFGDGANEAQMVYQFPLAPLTLNAFQSGSARHLREWASTLAPPSASTTFFNFLASHDGIGVVPATGILSVAEIDALVQQTIAHGGRVSFKNNPNGTQSPYELNITLFDALSDPARNDPLAVDRFVAAHAIALALQGVPGIYIHSLVGSHNDHAGVEETGRARSINREKWQRADLEAQLADPTSHARQVFDRMAALVRLRRTLRALHPNAAQRVLDAGSNALFAVQRRAPDGSALLCIHNVSAQPQTLRLAEFSGAYTDLIGDVRYALAERISVAPYQVLWLRDERTI